MIKILAINGSYRQDGVTDQIVQSMISTVRARNVEVEEIRLRDYPIQFCLNCRECTQKPGSDPGTCVQDDVMCQIIDKIEAADGFILASPTNYGTVTAAFKQFMERLTVYAYWPWEMNSPEFRKQHEPRKKAILVSSCAAPGIFGRLFYNTLGQLKYTAKTIGADTKGILFTGLIAKDHHPHLDSKVEDKAKNLAKKLVA